MFRTLTAWEIAAAVLADVWNVGMRACTAMSRDAWKKRLAMSKVSFREMKIILNQAARARQRAISRRTAFPNYRPGCPRRYFTLCLFWYHIFLVDFNKIFEYKQISSWYTYNKNCYKNNKKFILNLKWFHEIIYYIKILLRNLVKMISSGFSVSHTFRITRDWH